MKFMLFCSSLGILIKMDERKIKTVPDIAVLLAGIFDHIEMFYNSVRKHGYNGSLSPIEFEQRYKKELSCIQ